MSSIKSIESIKSFIYSLKVRICKRTSTWNSFDEKKKKNKATEKNDHIGRTFNKNKVSVRYSTVQSIKKI